MNLRPALVALAAGVFACDPARAASIGLYSALDCSSCNLTLPPGQTERIYICVDSAPWGSISGVEFRVVGLPADWIAVALPVSPSWTTVGDPFGSVGANLAFPSVLEGRCVPLYSVFVVAKSAASPVLRVTHNNPPSNPQAACPRLVPGAAPCFCLICVAGGQFFINSSTECTVAVDQTSWSRVKQLYRD